MTWHGAQRSSRACCACARCDEDIEALARSACGCGAEPPPEDPKEACWRAEVVTALKSLANPTRLRIVRELGERGEVCACDFGPCRTFSQPTISHRLRVLRAAGLVRCTRRGRWAYYRADPERLRWLRRHLL